MKFPDSFSRQRTPFIVAELSANHSQNLEVAIKSVETAAKCGVDAIKLQTVDPDKITLNCDNEYFRIPNDSLWSKKTIYELEVETFLPKEWHEPLFKAAKNCGIHCFSSPFDVDSINFLESINCPAYKIASFEITDLQLIRKAAATKKPIIISTGIATLEEIQNAVNTCHDELNYNITLLKCTSSYPASYSECNLKAMKTLGTVFNCEYGLSDHTIGDSVPIAAAALGATFIEKHFMLNAKIESADSSFSMTAEDFKEMVKKIRQVSEALGSSSLYNIGGNAKQRFFSRSLFIIRPISKGEEFTSQNIASIRPGYGISPKHLESIFGQKASKNIERGTPLSWDLIENN
ncbi:pseudaminic acid synthase [Synechococcus sp. KORDI-100]|uniref:pseudaminic acid synthase n=1 Tax=Synechococcus sp. KORDI-100 TaxID=1280380 RepID=UPI0008FFA5AD|nr:pseudaminic acid synthase [Synechococcus sp. KORDI-100]